MDEGQQPTVGERIKAARTRRGKSRAVVAAQVGKSTEWLKAVENGRLRPPRLDVLMQLARVLRITDLAELTGSGALPAPTLATVGHPATRAVQNALLHHPTDIDREPVGAEELTQRIADVWRARHRSGNHRTTLGELLPDLIRDAQYRLHVCPDDEKRQAHAALAEVYALAQFFLAYQPSAWLVWLVADRSMSHGRQADHPLAFGTGAWALAQVLRDAGELAAAREVVTQAIGLLDPYVEEPAALGLWASLHFDLGLTAAADGASGLAWRQWDIAERAARVLGQGFYHPMTSFSQAIMDVHAVSLAVELGHGGEAVRRGESFDATSIPSRPRRARHLVELARAYSLTRQRIGVLHVLGMAYAAAPETVRYNSYAREMSVDLCRNSGSSIRPEALDLARKLDLAV